jgi:hypothetical protein
VNGRSFGISCVLAVLLLCTFGQSEAFAVQTRVLMAGFARGDTPVIVTVRPDGTAMRVLARSTADYPTGAPRVSYRSAVWSPDHRRIAYDRFYNDNSDIWMMRADGTHKHQ